MAGSSTCPEKPANGGVLARPIPCGDRWMRAELRWLRAHVVLRNGSYLPVSDADSPNVRHVTDLRQSVMRFSDGRRVAADDNLRSDGDYAETVYDWIGVSILLSNCHMGPDGGQFW